MNELINTASSVGTYDGLSTEMTTEAVVVQLVDDLTITKAADRTSWSTGLLTYTIEIDNQSGTPYVAPVVTDIIDPLYATLVANSVKIDGVDATPAEFTFDAGTGLLTVNLSDVAATTKVVIEFKAERV